MKTLSIVLTLCVATSLRAEDRLPVEAPVPVEADGSVEPRASGATVIIVVGASGTQEYGKQFATWAKRWRRAAEVGDARIVEIGSDRSGDSSPGGDVREAGSVHHVGDAASVGTVANGDALEAGSLHHVGDAASVDTVANGDALEAGSVYHVGDAASVGTVANGDALEAGSLHHGDRERLRRALEHEAKRGGAELWLVLIGHGTFDGRSARFNLRGRDVTADELAAWLEPIERPAAVVNCASASGPFVEKLAASEQAGDRVIVTAAKSGYEQNFARFGEYMSQTIRDPESDLDKDGQTSLLEAWLAASRKTAEFYKLEGRLATEHALLEDNGDGRAAPPDWFRGVRVVRKSDDGRAVDGRRAHQFHLVRARGERGLSSDVLARRDRLELEVLALRDRKSELPVDVYEQQLEGLLVELAELYEACDPARIAVRP